MIEHTRMIITHDCTPLTHTPHVRTHARKPRTNCTHTTHAGQTCMLRTHIKHARIPSTQRTRTTLGMHNVAYVTCVHACICGVRERLADMYGRRGMHANTHACDARHAHIHTNLCVHTGLHTHARAHAKNWLLRTFCISRDYGDYGYPLLPLTSIPLQPSYPHARRMPCNTRAHTNIDTQTHTYKHAYKRTHEHTDTHKHVCARARTHTPILMSVRTRKTCFPESSVFCENILITDISKLKVWPILEKRYLGCKSMKFKKNPTGFSRV